MLNQILQTSKKSTKCYIYIFVTSEIFPDKRHLKRSNPKNLGNAGVTNQLLSIDVLWGHLYYPMFTLAAIHLQWQWGEFIAPISGEIGDGLLCGFTTYMPWKFWHAIYNGS